MRGIQLMKSNPMPEITPFLKSLLSVSGLSGYETPAAKLIEEKWRPLVDEPDQMIRMLDERLERSAPTTSTSSSSTASATTTASTTPSTWSKSQEFKEAAEAIRQVGQGQVRRLLDPPQGPRPRSSRRPPRRAIVDAIMLQYTPWLDKDSPAEQGARRLPRRRGSA